ncbi:MAG TPA: hypothetical protein VIN06_14400 [Devosia sp.]
MSQHPHVHKPNDQDLKGNPGIGQSSGIDNTTTTFEDEEGENTVEGDVMNDTRPDGSINPNQRGRTNK